MKRNLGLLYEALGVYGEVADTYIRKAIRYNERDEWLYSFYLCCLTNYLVSKGYSSLWIDKVR